jgi:LPXTG-site transpeptidase (sortase) family protein
MDEQYFQSEIHKLLKLGPDLSKPYVPPTQETPDAQEITMDPGLPFNLPIVGNIDDIIPNFRQVQAQTQQVYETPPLPMREQKATPLASKQKSWKGILVYPFVFLLAFMFFYVVLNFNALLLQTQSWFAKDEDEQILAADLEEYNKWIGGYYFSIRDNEKLEPNNDIDLDGLSNLDEFIIKTNPILADSDSDGITDGKEIINGSNPWGLGAMTKKQKEIVGKIDLIKVNNRISYNASSLNTAAVLGLHTENFDMTKPGRLTIPKLNLQVPIIWSEDPGQFDNDLTRGVVHYPGTALPGELGTVYISGHSSDYFWKKHPYKQVFAKLNALEPGDDIFVDVYGLDGKVYNFKYRVSTESIYAPDDQRQFIDNSGAKLNLSTCWPIGTQKDRYVVTAELQNL